MDRFLPNFVSLKRDQVCLPPPPPHTHRLPPPLPWFLELFGSFHVFLYRGTSDGRLLQAPHCIHLTPFPLLFSQLWFPTSPFPVSLGLKLRSDFLYTDSFNNFYTELSRSPLPQPAAGNGPSHTRAATPSSFGG